MGNDHKILLFCDDKSAVTMTEKILKWPDFPLPRDASEADLLYCIKHVVYGCREFFTVSWVQSHQEEKMDFVILDLVEEAQLNIEADRLASLALEKATIRPIITLKAPARCNLIINGAGVTSKRNKTIKSTIDQGARPKNILNRCGWTSEVFEKVNCRALGAALSRFSNSHQVSLLKLYNDVLSKGKLLVYWIAAENLHCASCACNTDETFEHMLDCPDHKIWRLASRKNLKKEWIKLGTPAILRKTLLNILFGIAHCVPRNLKEVESDCRSIGRLEI